jgi:hypothetical protein
MFELHSKSFIKCPSICVHAPIRCLSIPNDGTSLLWLLCYLTSRLHCKGVHMLELK